MQLIIRKATAEDIPLIMKMYDHSRSVMRANGNDCQWTGYPTAKDVEEDVSKGVSYMIDGCGTFALVPGLEPTYGYIDHGRWIDDATSYSTLHRLAALPGTHGMADAAFAFAKRHCDHLRADTHEKNLIMRHILEKEGFVYCGIVYMDDGGPRMAYEWWRWDEVMETLKQFVEEEVLPQYSHFDKAHGIDHARRVIARAMTLYRHLRERLAPPTAPIATMMPEMVYTAAAMHDLGLCEGREQHHIASGHIIRHSEDLKRWFDETQIETIARAAEDHRASATAAPRGIMGRIIAEADRDIEPETIVRRTVEYGLNHYPELDREGHWQRTLEHLHEKYSEGGYIKLWLPDSPNEKPLAELRELIRDEKRLRALFDQIIPPLQDS